MAVPVCPAVLVAEGALQVHVLEIEREVPVNVGYPLESEYYPDVPQAVGVLSAAGKNALSLEQERVVSTAFRRVYQEQLNAEFNPGADYENAVCFTWGSDIESYMLFQHVGVGGTVRDREAWSPQSFDYRDAPVANGSKLVRAALQSVARQITIEFTSNSPFQAWGIAGLAIIIINPNGRSALLIKGEFAVQYSTPRGDGYGGFVPDRYAYPVANEYRRLGYRAQPFRKGTMTAGRRRDDVCPASGLRVVAEYWHGQFRRRWGSPSRS